MIKVFDVLMRRPCAIMKVAQEELASRLSALDDASDELQRTVRDALDKTDRRRTDVGHAPDRRKARA